MGGYWSYYTSSDSLENETVSSKKPNNGIEDLIHDDHSTSTHGVRCVPTDDTSKYCKHLVNCEFYGQTSKGVTNSDTSTTKEILHLGYSLKLLDKIIRTYEPGNLVEDDEQFLRVLALLALKRKRDGESADECCKRLGIEFRCFVLLYNKRAKFSELLTNKIYWGTRQQLLSGKVIADYVDPQFGPLDPIFGVLLNPTTGRVGAGDSGILHEILFDDNGNMAYHAAVHDAYGYLKSFHDIGPGYDYLDESFLADTNFMAGQTSGLAFWSDTLSEIDTKLDVLRALKM